MTPEMFLLVPALLGGLAVAGTVFALARRRYPTRHAVLGGAAVGAAIALGWYLTTWVAAAGLIVGILVYAVSRIWINDRRVLLAGIGAYLVFTATVGAWLYAALTAMG